MANNENLIPFSKRTESELREFTRKGGKKSGETRRRKANFRRALNLLLTTEIDSEKWTPLLETLGLESTLETAMLMGQIKAAMDGDSRAARFVAEYAGQSAKTEADEKEQEIRTERAKRARDAEIVDDDAKEENIDDFLKAMRPTQEELDNLFADEEEEESDAENTEEAGKV